LPAVFAKESEAQINAAVRQKSDAATQAEEVMKNHIVGVFGFSLLLSAASAHAQITETVRVQVPFPFVVAGQNMPAAGLQRNDH
jgi:hypothetical protein